MDVVNFPGIIATHGLLTETQINLANDLLLIGKKVGNQRDGSQYEEMAMTVQEFANLVAIAGGNETLQQTLILGNITGGTNINISDGDAVAFVSGGFEGALVPTILTNNHFWTLPDATGTIALLSDIPAAATTLYSGNGITGSGRVVTITDTLEFTGGKVILSDGTEGIPGYIWTSIDASGTGSWIPSPTASTNIYNANGTIGSTRIATITDNLSFTGGVVNIGTTAGTARLTVAGIGTTVATSGQIWYNSTPTELMRFTDSGALCIGINAPTGGFANAEKLRVDALVTTDYTSTVVFDQFYSNLVNNGNSVSTLSTRVYKASPFNVLDMKAAYIQARNDGSGAITYLYGLEAQVWNVGAATINSAFAVSARCQIRDGVVTNYGGIDISYQENNSPAVVTNMMGVLVRTPVNVSGITVTNTYGVLIQGNTLGTNNYGFVSDSQSSNGFGTATPSLNAIAEFTSTTKAAIKLTPITAAQASAITAENGMEVYVSDTDATFTSVGFWGYEAGAWIKF